MLLLAALAQLRRFYPKKFDLVAVTIDSGVPGMDFAPVKALCEELFDHVFHPKLPGEAAGGLFACDAPDSVFLHLFQHFKRNDNHILRLLRGRNSELFEGYFREELGRHIRDQLPLFAHRKAPQLPGEFWEDHIANTLVGTLRWWIANDLRQSPEVITEYFFYAV